MIESRFDTETFQKLSPVEQFDAICDAFEQDYRAGRPAPLDEYGRWLPAEVQAKLYRELAAIERDIEKEKSTKTWSESSVVIAGDTEKTLGTQRTLPSSPEKAIAQIQLPVRFENFLLLEVLGKGAAGLVFRAEELDLAKFFAVKLPHRHFLSGDVDTDSFFREARNASKLSHPSIVQVVRVGEWQATPFIVSEYISGVELKRWMRQPENPKDPETLAKILYQLADALHHAHQQGIIHRDVKPSNIMIEEVVSQEGVGREVSYRPRLLDFGVSKLIDSASISTQQGEMLGTPAYMSPEQARGDARAADGRTDVYSLGAVFYELLTGEIVFSGPAAQLLLRIQTGDYVPVLERAPNVPKQLAAICQKCLEVNPEDRYASALELRDDLGAWLEQRPVKAKLRRRRKPQANAMRWKVAASLMAVTALSSVLMMAWMLNGPKSIPTDPKELLTVLSSVPPSNLVDFAKQFPKNNKAHIKSLKTILDERTVDHPSGLKALCLLAKLAPNELDQAQAKSWVDGILMQISSTELDSWLPGLEPLVPTMQDDLLQRIPFYADDSAENKARDNSIRMLCRGARADHANWINAAWGTSPDHLKHWEEWLQRHPEEAKQQIASWLAEVPWSYAEDDQGEDETRKIAQVYLLRYLMGDQGWEEILKQRPDPRPRTYFFHRLAHSKVSLNRLSELLLSTDDAGMLYGSLLCLGFAAENWSKRVDESPAVLNRIQNLYLNHVDSGVHSACLWTLVNMKQEEFVDASQQQLITEGLKTSLEKGRRWHVSSFGELFVHLVVDDESVYPKPWKVAIAALPLSSTQIEQFMNAKIPMRGPAAEFCKFNTTSGQALLEGLINLNDQLPVDALIDEHETIAVQALEQDQYSIDYFKKGFRIGLKSEIRLLCRNQAITARCFGSGTTANLPGLCTKVDKDKLESNLKYPWDAPSDLGGFWMCFLNEYALGGKRSDSIEGSHRSILNSRQTIPSIFPDKAQQLMEAWASVQVAYAPGRIAFFLGFVEEEQE